MEARLISCMGIAWRWHWYWACALHGVRKNVVKIIYGHDRGAMKHLLFAACRLRSGPDMEKGSASVCLAHRGIDLSSVVVTWSTRKIVFDFYLDLFAAATSSKNDPSTSVVTANVSRTVLVGFSVVHLYRFHAGLLVLLRELASALQLA